MSRKKMDLAILVLAPVGVMGFLPTLGLAGFTDNFPGNTLNPAWTVDRASPSSITVASNTVTLGVTPATYQPETSEDIGPPMYNFYDTQGITRADPTADPEWTVFGSIYVTPDMMTTTAGSPQEREGIWTSTVDQNYYPIIDITNVSDTYADSHDASATDRSVRWQVWNDNINDPNNDNWVDLSAPVSAGWNSLSITFNGSDFVYGINGSTVYTEPDTAISNPDLNAVYLETYNFNDTYNATFGAVSAVPEPASFSVLGLGALALMRRRRGTIKS